MEGLIPLICKAVKERRSRSYSRCSSAGSAADRFGAVAGAGNDQQTQWGVPLRAEHGGTARTEEHRRHRSLEELAGQVGSAPPPPEWRGAGGMSRGRSVRIFSCIGGGGM